MQKYIIGTKPVPSWCADKLMPYKKMDGSCGVEFHGVQMDIDLIIGDVLIYENGKIDFKKNERKKGFQ